MPSRLLTRLFFFPAITVFAVTALAQTQKSGTTFDCAKASGEVEKLICSDPSLQALDRQMATVYAKAMKAFPTDEATKQRALQRGWIKGRNDCWKASDKGACVKESYQTRIVELQIKSGQLRAPKAVEFKCTGGEDKPFTASFYNKADPPSAVFTFGDDQVIAFQSMAASGARYTAQDMEFWEHQGVAAVSWYGTKLTCKPVLAASSEGKSSLSGTNWKLVEFHSMDDAKLTPERDKIFTIAFGAEGRVSVRADCNRGSGTWKSSPEGELSFGPMAMTRAFCQSKMYDRFAHDLADVRSYVIKNGDLYLSLKVDGGIYRFSPEK